MAIASIENLSAIMLVSFQNKVYPREMDSRDAKYRGRIRIQIKNDDGTPIHAEFPDSKFGHYISNVVPPEFLGPTIE